MVKSSGNENKEEIKRIQRTRGKKKKKWEKIMEIKRETKRNKYKKNDTNIKMKYKGKEIEKVEVRRRKM